MVFSITLGRCLGLIALAAMIVAGACALGGSDAEPHLGATEIVACDGHHGHHCAPESEAPLHAHADQAMACSAMPGHCAAALVGDLAPLGGPEAVALAAFVIKPVRREGQWPDAETPPPRS